MTEPIPSLAETIAEIRWLRAELQEAKLLVIKLSKESLMRDVKDALADGTLAKPTEDEPSSFTGNVPPSAPPHNERPPIGNDDE